MSHAGYNGSKMWARMGVDMPVSKTTSVSWCGLAGEKITSELSFKQKVNDKAAVEFTNKYNNGSVDVGMSLNYTV